MSDESQIHDADVASASMLYQRLSILKWLAIIVFLIVIGLYLAIFNGELTRDQDKWGQFGDFVGGVLNPIFSLMALIALLATFDLQVRELKLSAKELKNSADALAAQNATMERQNQEASFFNLLGVLAKVVDGLSYKESSLMGVVSSKSAIKYSGREAFHPLCNLWLMDLLRAHRRGDFDVDIAKEMLVEKYFDSIEFRLGHYFQVVLSLVRFVDRSNDKSYFSEIIAAHLTIYEMELIHYYCLLGLSDELRDLVEKYELIARLYAGKKVALK
ncbi:putative phage abortive infection protein [Jeongeupia chitinilytica]|nr:putative phage abortive infection protein [Jeongeupia chitinilytica]